MVVRCQSWSLAFEVQKNARFGSKMGITISFGLNLASLVPYCAMSSANCFYIEAGFEVILGQKLCV